jgi:hypothetical protein
MKLSQTVPVGSGSTQAVDKAEREFAAAIRTAEVYIALQAREWRVTTAGPPSTRRPLTSRTLQQRRRRQLHTVNHLKVAANLCHGCRSRASWTERKLSYHVRHFGPINSIGSEARTYPNGYFRKSYRGPLRSRASRWSSDHLIKIVTDTPKVPCARRRTPSASLTTSYNRTKEGCLKRIFHTRTNIPGYPVRRTGRRRKPSDWVGRGSETRHSAKKYREIGKRNINLHRKWIHGRHSAALREIGQCPS